MKEYRYKRLHLAKPSDYAPPLNPDWLGWFDGKSKIADNHMDVLQIMGKSGWQLCDKSEREMIFVQEAQNE